MKLYGPPQTHVPHGVLISLTVPIVNYQFTILYGPPQIHTVRFNNQLFDYVKMHISDFNVDDNFSWHHN